MPPRGACSRAAGASRDANLARRVLELLGMTLSKGDGSSGIHDTVRRDEHAVGDAQPSIGPARDGEAFDLPSIDRELRGGKSYLRDGHAARTLARGSALRVTFVVVKAGGRLDEHRTKEESSVFVVSGSIRVTLRDRAVTLDAGGLLMLQAGEHHDFEATTDSSLVLNIGWRSEG